MTPPDQVVIKNLAARPERAPNHGTARVEVSAVVFTAADQAAITGVRVDPPFLQPGVVLHYQPGSGIDDTKEGLYQGTIDIPLLADPGEYQVPIKAIDSTGVSATALLPLRIDYQRPPYSGPITGPQNAAVLDRIAAPAIAGNRVRVLADGAEALDQRLQLIRAASKQIHLQTYALSRDGAMAEIIEALEQKAEAGIEVNLIINESSQLATSPLTALQLGIHKLGQDLQQWAEQPAPGEPIAEAIKEMILERLGQGKKGVNLILVDDKLILGPQMQGAAPAQRSTKWIDKLARDREQIKQQDRPKNRDWLLTFKGPGGLPSLPGIAYAVHEKILVVDGKHAIVGGRNLEDQYFTNWIDADVLVSGPAVTAIQTGFLRSWKEFAHHLPRQVEITQLLPQLEPAGDDDLRFVQSRPWLGERQALELVVTALQMAQRQVLITSQYVVLPDSLLRDAIVDAARRGVEVVIVTNSLATIQDVGFSAGYFLSLNYLEPLIAAGVKIYEVNGPPNPEDPIPYLHAKEFIVDSQLDLIGSMNLSIRSAFIESENLVAIQNPQIVADRQHAFQDLLSQSTPIDARLLQDLFAKFKNKIAMSRFLELIY